MNYPLSSCCRWIALLILLPTLNSCGKGTIDVFLNKPQIFKKKMVFRMSTQEKLLERYPVAASINLYELLPELDSLPIDYDSFAQVYNALKQQGEIYSSHYAVLVKTDSCSSQIGYCEAYLLNR